MSARRSSVSVSLDIQRAAYSMIDNHGRHAAQVASIRARNLGKDAQDSKLMWEKIVAAISEMQEQRRTSAPHAAPKPKTKPKRGKRKRR